MTYWENQLNRLTFGLTWNGGKWKPAGGYEMRELKNTSEEEHIWNSKKEFWVWISFLNVVLQGDFCLVKLEDIWEVIFALFLCWAITSFIFKDTYSTHIAQWKMNLLAMSTNKFHLIELFLAIQLPYIFPAHWIFCKTSI